MKITVLLALALVGCATTKPPTPVAAVDDGYVRMVAKTAWDACEKSGFAPGSADHLSCYDQLGRQMLIRPARSAAPTAALPSNVTCTKVPITGAMECVGY